MPRKTIRVEGEIAFIPLTRGYEAVIDAADVDIVAAHSWRAHIRERTTYAQCNIRSNDGSVKVLLMHRMLLNASVEQVDHRDGNGLNNRRENLRPATAAQNTCNRRAARGSSSGLIGVTWNRSSKKWQAQIKRHGTNYYLGLFSSKEEASRVRSEAAMRLHGEFARIDLHMPGDNHRDVTVAEVRGIA